MSKDDFGNRMKAAELLEAGRRFDGTKPVLIRVDGKRFSKFTKRFEKPFDAQISSIMRRTCKALVEEFSARIGYVQSDEITLVLLPRSDEDSLPFSGRIQKLVSISAAVATREFSKCLWALYGEEFMANLPVFDARAWEVTDQVEAMNAVLWRVFDARKNGISVSCRSVATTKEMHGLNGAQMIMLMKDRGLVFERDISSSDRNGSLCYRELERRPVRDLSDGIPSPADGFVTRSILRFDSAEVFLKMDTLERVRFIFGQDALEEQVTPA